ncbi:MAG: hypothetical protein AAF202_04615 [Pseudomonadota bacterium]
MKSIILVLLMLPLFSWAHCPHEVQSSGQSYCLDFIWDVGETKVRGEFQLSTEQTPYLIPNGDVPQKWVFSKAIVTTWKKGDVNHDPVVVPGLDIFGYMHMQDGHHHTAGRKEFYFDDENQYYVFRRVAFHQMPGCWSLRWAVNSDEKIETSRRLFNLTDFANLTAEGIEEQKGFCKGTGNGGESGGEHHHHH